ncbi:uncharacterized protein BDW43DRAFT_302861 [Aspergillus alliaceus]|uniref:uncharacterized protein n=1 Tax=Petromyces alliaceus TaxID=209559 RepID=UPI0012A62059|nr:uncharacterized protein BDW43DRAFT_302861 [Aspergillus alliaceus]KAB8229932.1 hypothetical protein BDW43DRAFT_302861 [Aspergillus alliaceus]
MNIKTNCTYNKPPLLYGKPGQSNATNIAQSTVRQAAFFASLFRGSKGSPLTDYDALVAAVQQAWDKSDTLDIEGSARKATFVRGLKLPVPRALFVREESQEYAELVQHAERIDSKLWACRSRRDIWQH